MRVIAKRTLRDFWEKHADCEEQLKSWYRETEKSEWKNINDLKNEYPSASILKDNRIVYNIKGNNYRLIVKFNFEYGICWIKVVLELTQNMTKLTQITSDYENITD